MNLLAENPKGVLVSKNMKDTYGCEVGDTITYNDSFGNSTTGKILDFVEYWPGYRANTLRLKPDGTMENRENLLVVANIATVQSEFGIYPYEVWADLKDDADVSAVYDWIEKEGFRVKKFRDKAAVMDGVYNDPLLQGTNGVLTMGFIVTIILCAVGYLIYWIMSIRSREMLFGVFHVLLSMRYNNANTNVKTISLLPSHVGTYLHLVLRHISGLLATPVYRHQRQM